MDSVSPVEVERETEHFIQIKNGRREAKHSDWRAYFKTENEAKDFLLSKKLKEVRMAEQMVKYRYSELQKLEEKLGRMPPAET